MNETRRNNLLITTFALGIIALVVAVFLESIYLSASSESDLSKNIEKRLHKQLEGFNEEFEKFKAFVSDDSLFYAKPSEWAGSQNYFFVFEGDSLVFWNSNRLVLPRLMPGALRKGMTELPNAFAYCDTAKINGFTIATFYPVQYVYRIENRFIRSHFRPELGIPDNSSIFLNNYGKSNVIKEKDNSVLFYINYPVNVIQKKSLKTMGLLSYFLFLFAMWSTWLFTLAYLKDEKLKRLLILVSFVVLFLIIWMISVFDYPVLLNYSQLFSPSVYATPGIFSSLGKIFIFSLLWFPLSFLFAKSFNVPVIKKYCGLVYGIIIALVFVEIVRLFQSVVNHSVINFELQQLTEVNLYTFLSYLIFLLLFGGWFLMSDKLLCHVLKPDPKRNSWVIQVALAMSTVFFLSVYFYGDELLLSLVTGWIIVGVMVMVRFRRKGEYQFVNRFFILFLMSILGFSIVWPGSAHQKTSKEETLLVNLASSALKARDLMVEMNLTGNIENIRTDYRLGQMLLRNNPDIDRIYEYLRRFYFNDIWRQYDIQIVLCWPRTDLIIEETGEESDCYSYFDQMVATMGESIDGKPVYFMNNRSGRVSYFAQIKFFEGKSNEISLFIDLETRAVPKGLGYPELLSDNNIDVSSSYNNYSFARYVEGKLVNYNGDYPYNNTLQWVGNDSITKKFNHFEHRFYFTSGNECFVISKPQKSIFDILLYIIYLFLFLFVITYVGVFAMRIKYIAKYWSLAIRIRISVIFILLLSFLMVGGTSIYFNVRQYKNKQLEMLREKNRSVLVALDPLLGDAGSVSELDPKLLTAALQDISNTLYIDIHLYGVDGELVASSRPLIFQRDLMNRQMAPEAFYELKYNLLPFVITNETIGELKYISAYQPLTNFDNKLLCYVNLPFFVSTNELSKDVSDFIVVLLNIYLIFVILAVLLTLVLTRQITRPLQMISEKITGFRLRGSNAKIHYTGRDELSRLVDDYNRLVDELERSAEQLATTERSLAWRQMARQIAHEIKNPLTPMKLSVQHLYRAYREKNENFETYLEKTTQTLVEQIDNLTRIANEFSSFSKMPESRPEAIDLVAQAESVVNLFIDTPDIDVRFVKATQSVHVYADKDMLIQVLNNLIKNAVQSIQPRKKGIIDISVGVANGMALTTITDNGIGIPYEARIKIFEPNFTTKSGGMGLGLAISRNIIVNAGGEIWFENNGGGGTTFYFSLPLYKE
jgi:two-component system, NtrC family, nitrogen regulation sensor histidine kinase NtrY